jgi:hypothetical protein
MVEFSQTGYSGFSLEKQIKRNMFVQVSSSDLDSPSLFIKKGREDDDSHHIIPLTFEQTKDLIAYLPNEKEGEPFVWVY